MTAYQCPCGRTHGKTKIVNGFVREFGATVNVVTPWGTWKVPRFYIASHGLIAKELPGLAERFGFERVE